MTNQRSRQRTRVGRGIARDAGGGDEQRAARVARAPKGSRKITREARREKILEAALDIFSSKGFEAARLDDVAKRAGVAKGTLYLYFESKEALFEQLIMTMVAPIIAHLKSIAADGSASVPAAFEAIFGMFQNEVLGTRRRLLMRLIISEGSRFPDIAAFYYREIVSPGLRMFRSLLKRAEREGLLVNPAVSDHPQLVVAPLLMAVVWDGLFGTIEALDVGKLMRAHISSFIRLPEGKGP
ncbi:MAG: TetR/AcrR family transcriptional regulator [Hyphomicrobiaceae bacterium]